MLLQIFHGDFGESNEVQGLAELGEEDIPVFTKDAGHQTQFPGFLGCHEVTLDVTGGDARLTLLQPLVEAVQQGTVGKGHVGKTSG
ncbi:hypothetical protein D3C86_1732030 [compost metagenome]